MYLHKSERKGGTYLSIVEGYREGGKVKHISAASMTTAQPHESADAANRTGSHADCQISTEITLWRSKPV